MDIINDIPKVSVIITVFNGEKYVRETLQSLLNQDYQNLEIIVIDDGSADSTSQIVQNFPAKIDYEYQQHGGIAAGWNRGVEKAAGRYISFIDADDTWSVNKTNNQVEFLENNPATDIIFGYAQEFHSPEIPDEHKVKKPVPGISACTMMIKREISGSRAV